MAYTVRVCVWICKGCLAQTLLLYLVSDRS